MDASADVIPCIHAEVKNDNLLTIEKESETLNDDKIERKFSHFDELLTNSLNNLIFESVMIFEVFEEQTNDSYCANIFWRLNEGEGLPFL